MKVSCRYLPRRYLRLLVVLFLSVAAIAVTHSVVVTLSAVSQEEARTHRSRKHEEISLKTSIKVPTHPILSDSPSLQPKVAVSNDPFPVKHTVSASPRPHAQCQAFHPRVVFFMRLPKCASTSFVNLLKSVSASSSFQFIFNPSGAYDWDVMATRKVVSLIQSKGGQVIYARHFYYVNFKPFGLTNFTYFTVIREPLSRFISSYLYYHHSPKRHIQNMLKPEHRNETLLECISREHNGCAHNWLTKYFCGHEKFCRFGEGKALSVAKENLKQGFAVVGVLEQLNLTLKVLNKVLPDYFTLHGEDLPAANKNKLSMVLSVEEEEAIQRVNSVDLKLYAYARELLQATASSCYVNSCEPEGHTDTGCVARYQS